MTAKIGTIGWIDMSVPNATEIKDFYLDVVGWTTSEIPMGDHSDFCMHPGEGEDAVAGICHALGVNATIPPGWLIYITVANLAESLAICVKRGGTIVVEPRAAGGGKFAVIRDPAGCMSGLYQN